MDDIEKYVDHYLSEFHAGRCDGAFHNLIEANSAVIPNLINIYSETTDVDTKVFIIEVISEFRLDSSISFLCYTLQSDDRQIWKVALNGLAMANPFEAGHAVGEVLTSVQDSEKRSWIEEVVALLQAQTGE